MLTVTLRVAERGRLLGLGCESISVRAAITELRFSEQLLRGESQGTRVYTWDFTRLLACDRLFLTYFSWDLKRGKKKTSDLRNSQEFPSPLLAIH